MFTVMTNDNSLRITINDNAGIAPTEVLLIADDPRAVVYAIYGYAKRHNLRAPRVGYAVRPA